MSMDARSTTPVGCQCYLLARLVAWRLLVCPGPVPQSRPKVLQEDIVPVVRTFPLSAMAEPTKVEFDLPLPGRNATTTLLLGIRVDGKDGAESHRIADTIKSAGLAAQIKLMRIGNTAELAVPLVRVERKEDGTAGLAPIAADGHVAGVRYDDVDDTSLMEAGHANPMRDYRTLAFASAQNAVPGRYRLSIRLLDPSPELAELKSELLVAYRHTSR
ncbi:MAG: hypothetical protein ACOH1V_15180 [Stenotrophomonas sp.]